MEVAPFVCQIDGLVACDWLYMHSLQRILCGYHAADVDKKIEVSTVLQCSVAVVELGVVAGAQMEGWNGQCPSGDLPDRFLIYQASWSWISIWFW